MLEEHKTSILPAGLQLSASRPPICCNSLTRWTLCRAYLADTGLILPAGLHPKHWMCCFHWVFADLDVAHGMHCLVGMTFSQAFAAFVTSPAMSDGTIAYVQRGRTVRLESVHRDRLLRACETAQRMGGIVSTPLYGAPGRADVVHVTF